MTAQVRRGVALVGVLAGLVVGVWLDGAGVTGNNDSDSDMGAIGLAVGLGLGLMAAALVRETHD